MRKLLVLFILSLTCLPAEGSTSYYTLVAVGGGYRNAIGENPPSNGVLVSPYFELGVPLKRNSLVGFHSIININPEDTSEISSVVLGGKYSLFLIPRLFYMGPGMGMRMEGNYKNEHNDPDQNSSVHSENAKMLFNMSLHAGLLYPYWKKNYLVLELYLSQSVGRYYPYSANVIVGLFSFI